MQDGSFYTMAAESDAEMREWIQVIKTVISSDNISQRSTRTDGKNWNSWPAGGYISQHLMVITTCSVSVVIKYVTFAIKKDI